MPPLLTDSEDDSMNEKEVLARQATPKKPSAKQIDGSEEGEHEAHNLEGAGKEENRSEEEEEEEEVYQVEKIIKHDSDFPDNQTRYQVKWLGYPKPEDRTWETEENLEGAREILQSYWDKIGGRPEPSSEPAASSKKRGRKSTDKTQTPERSAKKAKSEEPPAKKKDGRGRKRKSELNTNVEMMDLDETGRDGWEPPKAVPGAWEEGVVSVHTIEASDDGTKWAYLMWADEGSDGKKRQTKAKLSTCYVACPQIMLKFFESHLVFTDKVDRTKKMNGN